MIGDSLKPCPWCGSVSWNLSEHDKKCYLRMFFLGINYTHEDMVQAWNRRIYKGDETADYFILPKPKEALTEHYNTIETSDDGKVFMTEHINIIQNAFDNWRKEIDAKIQQKLFEAFRPTCKMHKLEWYGIPKVNFACSKCDASIYDPHPNFCPKCGAKVVNNE